MYLWLNFILFFNVVTCQRRVVGGERINKDYMVYLVPSYNISSVRDSRAYFCGGAIITPSFIITSSACIQYNEKKWAIAGYNRYVGRHNLATDKCASRYGRQIIYECVHSSSGLDRDFTTMIPVTNWRQADIGIVKVEKPFDFMDKGYYEYCSYPPNAIKFTTLKENIVVGTDVMVLGWGSRKYQRPLGYDFNINEQYLMAATTVIADAKRCKEVYQQSLPSGTNMDQVFDRYTICTEGNSNVDIFGAQTTPSGTRRHNNNTIKFEDLFVYFHTPNETITYYSTSGNKTFKATRRSEDPGPCQNDHGGPLVVWFGGREYLAGIASAFLVNEQMECVGPYLYTSLACAAKYLNCTMNREVDVRRQHTSCDDVLETEADLDKPLDRYSMWWGKPQYQVYPSYDSDSALQEICCLPCPYIRCYKNICHGFNGR